MWKGDKHQDKFTYRCVGVGVGAGALGGGLLVSWAGGGGGGARVLIFSQTETRGQLKFA